MTALSGNWRSAPVFAALAAFALSAPVAASAQDWATTAVPTDGGFRIGNPDAPVRLTSFLSYTCPACGAFSREAEGTLALVYVGGGHLQVEHRSMVRDPVDLTVTMLVRCTPPRRMAAAHAMFLERQAGWLARAQSVPQAQQAVWTDAFTSAERRRSIASTLGLHAMVERFGVNRIAADRCLSDNREAAALVRAAEGNRNRFGVTSTPSFAIDGTPLAGTHDWAMLQPQLDARIAASPRRTANPAAQR